MFKLELSIPHNFKLRTEAADVASRLTQLAPTLTSKLLIASVHKGYQDSLEATPAHPTTAAGTYQWHGTVGELRSQLIQLGWIPHDKNNCPLIISPDKSIAILVMTGDMDSGISQANPTNGAGKGLVIKNAVKENQQQELFNILEKEDSATKYWVLLYYVSNRSKNDTEIRVELSCPSGFNKGHITDWSERIILNTEFDEIIVENKKILQEQIPAIDVPVERKQAG